MREQYKKIISYINNMPSQEQYELLMQKTKLSDIEREICRLRYIKQHDFGFIADTFGYSCRQIQTIHKRAIFKIGAVAQQLGWLEL